MQKKSVPKVIYSGVSGQIFILVFAMFAFSFLIAEASGLEGDPNAPSFIAAAQAKAAAAATPPKLDPATVSGKSIEGGKWFSKGASPTPMGTTGSLQLRSGGIPLKDLTVSVPNGPTFSNVQSVVPPVGDKLGSITYIKEGVSTTTTINPEQYSSISDGLASKGVGLSGTYKTKVFGIGPEVSGMWAHLATGVGWAVAVVGIIQLVGNIAGLDKQLTNSLSAAAGLGIIGGSLVKGLAFEGKLAFGTFANKIGLTAGQFGFIAGVGIAAAVFLLMYKKEEKKLVKFECLPWEAPLGGKKCEECNKDPSRPCTEYRCKALGQACDLVNKGTKLEQCVYKSVNDAKSPMITPWKDVLSPNELNYITDTSVRPPAIGVKITSKNIANGCLPAYTPLKFGITTDEPSQCKIDFNATTLYTDMQYYLGESNYYAYNHTQKMRLPAPDASSEVASPIIRNDGSTTMYIRCQDANGNYNVDAYAVSFCVDKGPDTTPPIIEEFSIPSGNFVQYKKDSIPIDAYVNEPAQCKWSVQSKTYETMENTMTCLSESYEVNADLVYPCKGNVTGVKDRADNTYYFRCKDAAGNVNVASKELVLKGSQPLDIFSSEPNGTISGSTDIVKVDLKISTTNGAEDGKAVCAFSPAGQKDFVKMFETGAIEHKQTLTLPSGNYNFSLKCIDSGGNIAQTSASFVIKVDKQSPKVTRAYRFNTEAMRIVTDEDAECVYSLTTCNYKFNEGIAMIHSPIEKLDSHLAEWKDNAIYHVKCSDAYDNEPDPNACNLVVSASQLAKENEVKI